jgi:hypothetical protein
VVGDRSPLVCIAQMPEANARADHVTGPDDDHLHRRSESRDGEGSNGDPGARFTTSRRRSRRLPTTFFIRPTIQVLRQQDSMRWRSVNSQARPRRRNR